MDVGYFPSLRSPPSFKKQKNDSNAFEHAQNIPTQDREAEGNGRSEKEGLLYQHRSKKINKNKTHFGMALDVDMFGFVLSLLP